MLVTVQQKEASEVSNIYMNRKIEVYTLSDIIRFEFFQLQNVCASIWLSSLLN